MKLSLTGDHRLGWVLADESQSANEVQSFSYVIPWKPEVRFEEMSVVLAGERRGSFVAFDLNFNGHLFVQPETGIRFALNDPLSPNDFRGLPFLRAFPYTGERQDILKWYGIDDLFAFLPLIPLDLIKMDQLYLDDKVTFVGVTSQFGMHVTGADRAIVRGTVSPVVRPRRKVTKISGKKPAPAPSAKLS